MRYKAPIKYTTILVMDMKPAWACLLITIILITGCTSTMPIIAGDKPTSASRFDGFDSRLVELRQRIDSVATLLQEAEGLVQTACLIDLQVASFPHDEDQAPDPRHREPLRHLARIRASSGWSDRHRGDSQCPRNRSREPRRVHER